MKKSELIVGRSYWCSAKTTDIGCEARLISLTPDDDLLVDLFGRSQHRSNSLVEVEIFVRNFSRGGSAWIKDVVPCSNLRGDYALLKQQAEETYLPKFERLNELLELLGAPRINIFGSSEYLPQQVREKTLDLLIESLTFVAGLHNA